jgi:hypothetical protein
MSSERRWTDSQLHVGRIDFRSKKVAAGSECSVGDECSF